MPACAPDAGDAAYHQHRKPWKNEAHRDYRQYGARGAYRRECAEVIDAGSVFVVTPVFKPEVIEVCRRRGVCVVAGALTPSEIFAAWEAGADVVKVFPAKAMGGAAYLRMVHEPLPHILLTPTGGVTLENLADYLRAGALFVGAGGDLVNRKAVDSGDRRAITERSRQYMAAIRTARSRNRS